MANTDETMRDADLSTKRRTKVVDDPSTAERAKPLSPREGSWWCYPCLALAIVLVDLIGRWCSTCHAARVRWSDHPLRPMCRRCAFGLYGGHGLPNRRALIATITVLTDINTAPKAGVSTIPQGAATPAASGMANAL